MHSSSETEVAAVQGENRRLREENSQLKLDLQRLESMLKFQQRLRFAPSSERHVSQPLLIQDAAVEAALADESATAVDVPGHKRRKRKRPVVPENAPREVVEHDLDEEDKVCREHGVRLDRDGETRTVQVEMRPAQVRVVEHVCPKYRCTICDRVVKAVAPPPSPIPGSIATPSLLAHIATAKFADGLPLYRQEGILARAGIELSRTTMATWMGRLAALLMPLTNLFNDVLLESPVIYMDETHLQVLNAPSKIATSKSYLWVRVGGTLGREVVLFHFDPSRSSDVPMALLDGYKGYITTDDYGGYNRAEGLPGIRRLQCWMHIRRHFNKALKALGKAGRGGIAEQAIGKIRELYAVERDCVEMGSEDRRELRLARAGPLLTRFRDWLQAALDDVPPKGATGKAIEHALKVWPQLVVYLEDGNLRMDNAPAENAIRPVAVGRKNWLFSDSVEGAEATATLYSVIETAKKHGLDPYWYLSVAIDRLTTARTAEDVEALLPWNLAKTARCASFN